MQTERKIVKPWQALAMLVVGIAIIIVGLMVMKLNNRIVLAVDNRDLSGDFTADLTDPEAALTPVSASAESTLSFSGCPWAYWWAPGCSPARSPS